MKPWIAISLTLCTVVLPVFGASWETSSFRTARGNLINTGMLMTEVRNDAGEPLERRNASSGAVIKGKGQGRHEVWIYRGPDGIYSLSFNGNLLSKIEVKPFRDR